MTEVNLLKSAMSGLEIITVGVDRLRKTITNPGVKT